MTTVNLRKLFDLVLVMLIADILIIVLMPKFFAYILLQLGHPLNSENNTTIFLMGIGIRVIGFVLFLFLMIKKDMLKRYQFKLKGRDLLLSWMFLVYIAANIQTVSLKGISAIDIALMLIECVMIGLYEETIFRGFVLSLLLKDGEKSRKKIISAVVLSSVTFGLMHLSNIADTALIPVLYQVVYATIIGFAFSAILIRTNWNLLWCVALHALYDIADGFTAFLPKAAGGTVSTTSTASTEILPYALDLLTFLPLLLYALFLLRKVGSKQDSKFVNLQVNQ